MQKWKKIGLIFTPLGTIDSVSHCQHPTPIKLVDSCYRIFYGSRNSNNLTQIFYFDFDIERLQVLDCAKSPFITLGEVGFFDHHGVYPSSVLKEDEKIFLYTIGFSQGMPSPLYYTRIGLVTGSNWEALKKHSVAPILNVSDHDPCTVTGPFVMRDGDVYRMWYVSGYKWNQNAEGKWQSRYHIKYAESKDGIKWEREGLVSIGHFHSGETNIARPWIIKEEDVYKAWYSYYVANNQGYRIGYAESMDGGYTFERKDHLAGITVSAAPWENEAVAYPAVIVHKGRKYMFYNGNKFGKDGIALAIED